MKESLYIVMPAYNEAQNIEAVVTSWYSVLNGKGDTSRLVVADSGKSRAFVERVVCLLLRCIFGVKVPDANAPYRLMRSDLLARYIDRLPDDYNIPNIMLTTYFSYYGEDITFRTISFKPRQGGTNSINLPRIVKIGLRALGDFRRFKKAMGKAEPR